VAKVVLAASRLAVYRCRVGAASPAATLACHRDMLAVVDKVLEHADHRQHGRQRRILEVDRRVIRRRERRPE
jgi:hypothetical protein